MGMRGPAPSCVCHDFEGCQVCRSREQTRRRYHGLSPLPPKPIYRAARFTAPTDSATLGYLAGLMDGEGCITRSGGRLRVQIAMTDEPVIRWLGEMGGTVKERAVVGNRRRCWGWLLLAQADVLAFLVAVSPHMRVKREAALATIEEIQGLMERQRVVKGGTPLREVRMARRRKKAAA